MVRQSPFENMKTRMQSYDDLRIYLPMAGLSIDEYSENLSNILGNVPGIRIKPKVYGASGQVCALSLMRALYSS